MEFEGFTLQVYSWMKKATIKQKQPTTSFFIKRSISIPSKKSMLTRTYMCTPDVNRYYNGHCNNLHKLVTEV